MARKLTILMAPMEGVGHVNACIGLGEYLASRGHTIVFLVDKAYAGKLVRYGFVEEIYNKEIKEEKKPGEVIAGFLKRSGLLSDKSSFDKIKLMSNSLVTIKLTEDFIKDQPKMKAIIDKHNPDVYILDHMMGSPYLIYSDKPWVSLFSVAPLYAFKEETLPPPFSGYPTDGDQTNWKEFREVLGNTFKDQSIRYNEWLKENGFPTIPNNRCIPKSPYLNLYLYPEELDYTDIRPVPDKWLRIDGFVRKGEEEFKLPDKLKERNENSKLIYLSLGSMGSIDVELMTRLVKILSKSKHKYIVSKGMLGDKYELPDNMWGENSVPQTKVLPLVDLVITHGGNNSVTETFSLGKPMIVMPLFGDQFDNAQRIDEKGFGVRLDPYNCSDEELLNAIEKLLNDKQLSERLSVASKRILTFESLRKVCELIESLANK